MENAILIFSCFDVKGFDQFDHLNLESIFGSCGSHENYCPISVVPCPICTELRMQETITTHIWIGRSWYFGFIETSRVTFNLSRFLAIMCFLYAWLVATRNHASIDQNNVLQWLIVPAFCSFRSEFLEVVYLEISVTPRN